MKNSDPRLSPTPQPPDLPRRFKEAVQAPERRSFTPDPAQHPRRPNPATVQSPPPKKKRG